MGAIVTKTDYTRTTTYSDLRFRLRLDIAIPDSENNIGIRISDELDDPQKGLDMDFHIIKSTKPEPETSTIKIYNLSSQTYDKIYKSTENVNKAPEFSLYAAFSDEEYSLMYRGYPLKSTQHAKQTILTTNQGFLAQDANAGRRGQNDLETEISLKNFSFAWLNKSYRAGVGTELILNDCIEALGIPKGEMDTITHKNLTRSYTARGSVNTTLNYLAQLLGFDYCFNNGTFCLYDKKRQDIKKYGIFLHSGNSAIPEKQDDEFKITGTKKKGYREEYSKRGYMIETRLLPFLQIGSTVKCDFKFRDCKGLKYIYKLEHIGSNYAGSQMVTRVYCV